MALTEDIRRSFPAKVEAGEGRIVEGRLIPYGVEQLVSDDGGATVYRESFSPGAFDRVERAPHRIMLTYEHEEDFGGVIGHGLAFDNREDALYGSFRILDGEDGDKALQLLRAGTLHGLSVEARVGPGRRGRDRVLRTSAHLDKVGLCREPAYSGAEVLALRNKQITDEVAEILDLDPEREEELDERLRQLGVLAASDETR